MSTTRDDTATEYEANRMAEEALRGRDKSSYRDAGYETSAEAARVLVGSGSGGSYDRAVEMVVATLEDEEPESDDGDILNCCDRCGHMATEHERALGWPVASDDGQICPDCYEAAGGDDRCHCGECGELLAAIDGAECPHHPDVSDLCVYDAETNELVDDATVEQAVYSRKAGPEGRILINEDGEVVREADVSLAKIRGETLRTVYVR